MTNPSGTHPPKGGRSPGVGPAGQHGGDAPSAPGSRDVSGMFSLPYASAASETRDIPLSAWHTHGPFAVWLVETLRPRLTVELGTHYGYSFFTICHALRDFGLSGSVYAVDTWAGDDHAGVYGEEVFSYVRDVVGRAFPEIGHMLRTTFDEAAGQFAAGTIDLLHIDGLHTYDAVLNDYQTWRDRVRPGGVILFHDIAERKDDFGVWRLWEQVSAGAPAFAFHHGHGLGVLGVAGDFPHPLARLFQLDPEGEEADVVRRIYEKLGERVVLRRQLIDTYEEIERAKHEIDRLHASRSWRWTAPLRAMRRAGEAVRGAPSKHLG